MNRRSGPTPRAPVFSGKTDDPKYWREWLARVRLWRKKCRFLVDPSELATLILCELTEEAAEFFEEWTDKELGVFDTDDGLDKLIATLRPRFGQEAILRRKEVVREYEKRWRHSGETMKQYIQRFGDLRRKLQAVGVLLPEDYLAQRLLERARLWPQEETAVLGACNQEYAWEPIVKQLVFMFPDKASLVRRRDPSGSAEGGYRTPRAPGRGSDGRWKAKIKIGARVSPGSTGGQGQPFQRRAYVTEADYDDEAQSDGPPGQDDYEEADADSAAAEAYMQEGVDDGWTEEDYGLEDIPEEELLNDLPPEFW